MPEVLSGEAATLYELATDPTVEMVLHLAKNAIDETVDSILLGQIVESDFPGYVPKKIEHWTNIPLEGEDFAELLSEDLDFTADVIVTPQKATAEYLTVKQGNGVPTLQFFRPFSVPIPFAFDGATLTRRVRLQSAATT